jgi:hypothetical protein
MSTDNDTVANGSTSSANDASDALLETRAAIDVMFEALAHLQASMETASENQRAQAYRRFKDALYSRFDYLVEERRGDAEGGDEPDVDGTLDPSEGDSEEATLEKYWPTIAKNHRVAS